jgi:hypothetical protein
MWVGGQRHAPPALPPGKRPDTHCIGGWVGPRAGLDGCGKSRPPPGFDPRTFHPVASSYTDCGIPAPNLLFTVYYLLLLLMFKELPRPQFSSRHVCESTA